MCVCVYIYICISYITARGEGERNAETPKRRMRRNTKSFPLMPKLRNAECAKTQNPFHWHRNADTPNPFH